MFVALLVNERRKSYNDQIINCCAEYAYRCQSVPAFHRSKSTIITKKIPKIENIELRFSFLRIYTATNFHFHICFYLISIFCVENYVNVLKCYSRLQMTKSVKNWINKIIFVIYAYQVFISNKWRQFLAFLFFLYSQNQ